MDNAPNYPELLRALSKRDKYIPNVCRNGVNPLSNLAFEEAANISAKEHSMLPIDSWSRGSWLGLVQSSMENLRYCKKKKNHLYTSIWQHNTEGTNCIPDINLGPNKLKFNIPRKYIWLFWLKNLTGLKICRYLHPNLVVVYISGNPSLTDQEGWTDKLIYSKNTMWYKRPHKQPLKQGMEFEVKWSWGKTL